MREGEWRKQICRADVCLWNGERRTETRVGERGPDSVSEYQQLPEVSKDSHAHEEGERTGQMR